MKLILMLILLLAIDNAVAIGISPASLDLEMIPGEVIEKQFTLYGAAIVESSSWITTTTQNGRIIASTKVPEDTSEGIYQQHIVVREETPENLMGVSVGAKIPITIKVLNVGFPVTTGLFISASIIVLGLGIYAVADRKKLL